jgi:hypothetical protein
MHKKKGMLLAAWMNSQGTAVSLSLSLPSSLYVNGHAHEIRSGKKNIVQQHCGCVLPRGKLETKRRDNNKNME